ncbi:MAG: single-stranded DNA-binding protein [Micrococcaceae bacterium]
MAGETIVTVVGNLTADPDIRVTPSNATVANFTIASTPRTYNRQTGQWEDGEPLYLRATAWRDLAKNIGETLSRGTRVIASGRLKMRSYETKEGERRTSTEIDIEEIGPSLRFTSAILPKRENANKAPGLNNEFNAGIPNNSGQSQSFGAGSGSQVADPWTVPSQDNTQSQGGWGAIPDQGESPF